MSVTTRPCLLTDHPLGTPSCSRAIASSRHRFWQDLLARDNRTGSRTVWTTKVPGGPLWPGPRPFRHSALPPPPPPWAHRLPGSALLPAAAHRSEESAQQKLLAPTATAAAAATFPPPAPRHGNSGLRAGARAEIEGTSTTFPPDAAAKASAGRGGRRTSYAPGAPRCLRSPARLRLTLLLLLLLLLRPPLHAVSPHCCALAVLCGSRQRSVPPWCARSTPSWPYARTWASGRTAACPGRRWGTAGPAGGLRLPSCSAARCGLRAVWGRAVRAGTRSLGGRCAAGRESAHRGGWRTAGRAGVGGPAAPRGSGRSISRHLAVGCFSCNRAKSKGLASDLAPGSGPLQTFLHGRQQNLWFGFFYLYFWQEWIQVFPKND